VSEQYPYIRLRWKRLGGHVHCRLFTASNYHGTYSKCGDLTFSAREWDGVCGVLKGVEIVPEEALGERSGTAKEKP
jgi:hypothetical protein